MKQTAQTEIIEDENEGCKDRSETKKKKGNERTAGTAPHLFFNLFSRLASGVDLAVNLGDYRAEL